MARDTKRPSVTPTVAAAVVANGLLVGASLDQSIKQLPARHRIGVTAFAAYSQAADLRNGVAFHAAFGLGAAALTLTAFALARRDRDRASSTRPAVADPTLIGAIEDASRRAGPRPQPAWGWPLARRRGRADPTQRSCVR